MTNPLIPLDSARAIAFHAAFEKRNAYISAEQIHLLVDGDASVPFPGCPECAVPSESVLWATREDVIDVGVQPCGHSFRIERPVLRESVVGDGTVIEEWRP
ncbi:hypothetical protein ACFV9E_06260 [Streptomyces sp. NPDC059835]|uniref:hypothetical protein n=1 Tax=Streptomyces sp. NPDC059835 TaxID=3346967 RepID=UPI003665572C